MTARTITIRTIYHGDDPIEDDAFEQQLRHHLLKLRWIGFEGEADEVAERIKRLHLDARGVVGSLVESE